MKTLILMRHGDAPHKAQDSERILSRLGQTQCREMASKLAGMLPTCCLSSDYQRAMDSASILLEALGSPIDAITSEELRPSADARRAMSFILGHFEEIEEGGVLLLVCHLPLIAELAALCLEGVIQGDYRFPCASLMAMQSDVAAEGCFNLLWQDQP